MSDDTDDLVRFDYTDAEALWNGWAPPGEEDILVRAAFERGLRVALDQDDALYFRPGGWVVNLPAAAARVACAAGILAASFQLAGFQDVEPEIIIAAASFVAAMEVEPVRLGRRERRVEERLRKAGLEEVPVSAADAHRALPKKRRREVSRDEVADALDRLVDAGLADHDGEDEWVLRAEGKEAWIRIRFTGD